MPEAGSEDKVPLESGKWSIDFVEHLRTVHFSLIVVSIGLLLISLSGKNYETDPALREIHEIGDLQAAWSPRWIQRYGGHIDQLIIPSSTRNNTVVLSDLSSAGEESETLYGRITLGKTPKTITYIRLIMPRNLRVRGSLSFPKTLDQFGRWWDGLNGERRSFELIQELYDEASVTSKSGAPVGTLVISPKPFSDRASTVTLTLEFYPFDFEGDEKYRLQDSFDLTAAIQGTNEVTRIRAARVVAISYDQNTVISGEQSWLSGSYEDSFKDLRLAAKGYESRPFVEVSQLISNQTGKATETFEVFGLKLPTDYITYWGASLLLAVQLYFLIYVNQLSKKLNDGDPGWDVPWIGLDQSKAGKGLYLFSVLVLPLLTLLALATRIVIPSFRHSIFVLNHTAASRPEGLLLSVFIQGILFLLALSVSPVLGLRAWRATPKTTT